MKKYINPKQRTYLKEIIKENGINIVTSFIPLSKSKNKNKKYPTLNWQASLMIKDKMVLTIEFYKSHSLFRRDLPERFKEILCWECEAGTYGRFSPDLNKIIPVNSNSNPAKDFSLDIIEFLHCITTESIVLDYKSFDDWSKDFEYDADRVSVRNFYDVCISVSNKMRNGLGEGLFETLRRICILNENELGESLF